MAQPTIYPIGTWLLGSFEKWALYEAVKVTGYNAKKTIMTIYMRPHWASSVTERKARWSKKYECWRYTDSDNFYVRLSSERNAYDETHILTQLGKDPTSSWTLNELCISEDKTKRCADDCILFGLKQLESDNKVIFHPETKKWSIAAQ